MARLIELEPLGDAALIVRIREAPVPPTAALPELLRIQRQLQFAALPGVTEVVTGYSTVAVFYDPVTVHAHAAGGDSVFECLKTRIADALAGPLPRGRNPKVTARIVDIPVCYDPEFALDLGELSTRVQLPQSEVVRLHSLAEYVVQCVGFTPGFPYLGGLPSELATPRRANPRTQVPAGSVAIGGSQAGIYPLSSPGGWNVIGRTPLRLFSAEREQPALLATGDRVRFHPITIDEFHACDRSLQSAANK